MTIHQDTLEHMCLVLANHPGGMTSPYLDRELWRSDHVGIHEAEGPAEKRLQHLEKCGLVERHLVAGSPAMVQLTLAGLRAVTDIRRRIEATATALVLDDLPGDWLDVPKSGTASEYSELADEVLRLEQKLEETFKPKRKRGKK